MKKVSLVPLASALAAIVPTVGQASVQTGNPASQIAPEVGPDASLKQPNAFYFLGDDLMGLVTSTAEDGTMTAEHYSHSSHASHASHASHYSGR